MKKSSATSVNRRNEIIAAAIEVFAEQGYYRATTAQVAERAEISQPYVFRFFSTKEKLLVEALEASWNRIIEAFQGVAASAPDEEMEQQLIDAYSDIMNAHRNEIILQMQAQTIQEPAIAEVMQRRFREIHEMVYQAFQKAGIERPLERTMLFLARGMLCNISLSLNLPELMKAEE
ncbi:TetR/AcrR family transcriptional regulator [Paenibacillus wulumuqiensis]|uniref:TetR/AcrR family transcriptional regulator n=1 Tax=Paenibacillus wulumuqiensis TaxID=1567107 RepID=UPI000619CF95|nr:TetR/AcrR family transcriptional regulator [Paenibacillus wulumuqiensis]